VVAAAAAVVIWVAVIIFDGVRLAELSGTNVDGVVGMRVGAGELPGGDGDTVKPLLTGWGGVKGRSSSSAVKLGLKVSTYRPRRRPELPTLVSLKGFVWGGTVVPPLGLSIIGMVGSELAAISPVPLEPSVRGGGLDAANTP